MKLLSFFNHILNLIYPNVCGICNKLCNTDICKKCEIRLKSIAKFKIDYYSNKSFKKHLYIFKYEGIIKEKLINFKFNEKTYIYKSIVNFMIKNKKTCGFFENYDIIIPVPIHKKRKSKRGYNQSALFARMIAKNILKLQFEDNVLIKKVNNKPQSTKNKIAREKNVIGAYLLKNENKITGKKILLLDDIYTTGSTVNECCNVLKKAKPKCVDVITIAKD